MKTDVMGELAWGAGILALALAADEARKLGLVEGDTVRRVVTAAIGLMIAWQGDRIPKAVAPNACAARAKRVAGWSLALSGLVYAALWAFAPIPVAFAGGCGAIVAGMAVTLGYCLSLQARAKGA